MIYAFHCKYNTDHSNKFGLYFLPLLHPVVLIPSVKLIVAYPNAFIVLFVVWGSLAALRTSSKLQGRVIIDVVQVLFDCLFLLPTSLFTTTNLFNGVINLCLSLGSYLLEILFVALFNAFILPDQDLSYVLHLSLVYTGH